MSFVSKSSLKPYLQLHFIVLIWGFTAVLGELIKLSPLEIVFYRTLIAAVGLYLVMCLKDISPMISRQDVFKLMGTGFIIGAHWVTFFLAARMSNISICLAGIATTSLWTSFLEPLVGKKKINWVEPLLGLVSACGIVLVFNSNFDHKFGLVIAIVSAILAAIFSVINGKLVTSRNHYTISMYEMLGACLITLIFILIFYLTGLVETIRFASSEMDLFYLLILGGVCTVYAYSVGVKLMKKLSVFTVNLTINLEPVYGVILAFLLFREQEKMELNFYAGAALIIISIFIYPLVQGKRI